MVLAMTTEHNGLDGGTRAVEHLRAIAAELGMAAVGPQVAINLSDDKDKRSSEMAMYVLAERGGQWWLAAGQNTPVAERPQHQPGWHARDIAVEKAGQ